MSWREKPELIGPAVIITSVLYLPDLDFPSRTHPTTSLRDAAGRSLDTNPLIQIEANVSTFQRLSGSLSSLFIPPTVISGSHGAFSTSHYANVKSTPGCAFKTVCFMNTGIARSDVCALGWSAGMNPGVSRDRVSGEGAQLQK